MCFRKAIVVVASCAFALGIGAGQSQAQTSSAVSLKDAQTTLKELGYYKGAVDGIYGPLTQRALEQYQREHDLKASGRLDSATAARLHGGSASSSPIQPGANEVTVRAGEAKRSVSVRTDESASDKPKGSMDDVKESTKEGADATKEGAKAAGDAAKGAGSEIKGAFGGGDDKKKKKEKTTE